MRFVNLAGVLQKARRYLSKGSSFRDEEASEPARLGEAIRQIQKRITDIEAVTPPEAIEFEVDCPDQGGSINLAHNFGGPVRYYVTTWRERSSEVRPVGYRRQPYGIVPRACSIGTWQNTAAGQTNGVRFTLKRRRDILGIRFAWVVNAATNYNIRCVLWNDTTGAVINEVTVVVNPTGIYEAFFATPTTTDLTSAGNLTVSVYELSNTRQTTSTDGVWKALQPMVMGNDLTIVHFGLVSAGNARPTVAHGGATTVIAEPILGEEVTGPELVMDTTNSTTNILALKSWVRGRAVIRIEPAQSGLSP